MEQTEKAQELGRILDDFLAEHRGVFTDRLSSVGVWVRLTEDVGWVGDVRALKY